ncbi:AMP-binding protein [Rhodobacterales bacterium HKCCE3408]|nr:AMP-binding protein [Rhodobacterales bacterium HKCCE3408]
MNDLVTVFRETASRLGDAPALIRTDETVSFAQLLARADAFGARLTERGIRRGDRLLLAMPVGPDLFAALAGAWTAGATVVFPEPATGLAGLRHAIAATNPRGLIASGAYRLLKLLPALWRLPVISPGGVTGAKPGPAPAPGDVALISFTSGSTGRPKAIARSHAFLMAQHAAVAPMLAGEAVDLVAFPVFTLVNLAAGRPSVLPDWRISRPDSVTGAALAARITATGTTRALLPPALCERLATVDRPASLHTVFTGGGPVKPALVARLRAKGYRVVAVYGSTEAEPIAELDWAEVLEADLDAMAGGAGLLAGAPVAAVNLRLIDDEIVVAGDHVNTGYLDPSDDAATKIAEGGRIWHRTGDAGRLDETGRLWLLGRHGAVQDGPEGRLYPFAVELAAEGWPGVHRAALSRDAHGPVLVIEGTGDHRRRAAALGLPRVRQMKIPMDRRHRSKVDYTALARALR